MKKSAALLTLVVSLTFIPQLALASTPSAVQKHTTVTSKTAAQTPHFKTDPADPSAEGSTKSKDNIFRVNDATGLLLTCIAPQIDTNPDTDVFNNCALAPGRTLDDLMHSIVQTIHFVQKQQMKESAERDGEQDQKSEQKSAQK